MRVDTSLGWVLVAATVFLGCGDSDGASSSPNGEGSGGTGGTNTLPGQGPGRLFLTQMEGMETRELVGEFPTPGLSPQDGADAGDPAQDAGAPQGPIAFDLRELKGSRDFYFILRNPGATPSPT